MPTTDAQRKAKKKYYDEKLKNISCSVKKQFAEQLNDFMQSEQGKKFESKSKFIAQAIREKMIAEGYDFKD